MDKLTIVEIENLIKCILKDFILVNNFNEYTNRRDLDFYYNVTNANNTDDVKVVVRNTKKRILANNILGIISCTTMYKKNRKSLLTSCFGYF